MEQRLLRAGFGREEVEDTIDRLRNAGLLDDVRFARALAERLHARGRGIRAVTSALRARGVDDRLTREVLTGKGEDELDRARSVALRRMARLERIEAPVAYRRLCDHLLRCGYEPEVARRAAREAVGGAADADP